MKEREKIQSCLLNCIHLLKVNTHENDKLVNIFTGEESGENVNVHEARQIGKSELTSFNDKLPCGFRERMTTNVKTMMTPKENKKAQVATDFNTDLIFSRVMYLLGTDQLEMCTVFQ